MANLYGFRYLPEELPRFRFPEAFPRSDVGMEVPVCPGEHQVEVAVSHQDLVQRRNPGMRI